jgi:hypothetical protein
MSKPFPSLGMLNIQTKVYSSIEILKTLFLLLVMFILSGCFEQEIYTEINEPSYIAHPPKSLRIDDIGGMLESSTKSDPKSPISVEVYIHYAHCTNAKSRSLGSDFDGYIRITLKENNTTIARAQKDYKGEATPEEVTQVYDHLMETLQWNP